MKTSSSLLLTTSAVLSHTINTMVSAAQSGEQCYGYTPMPSVSTYLGAELSYSTAQRICCNNHRFAEYSGYLAAPEVDLFGKLDANGETVFYDSVCGLPLFIAPRGRSFDEFKEESLKHGWPSFRPEELVSENVIIHDGGRMESRCLTHLGHNLPEGGVDRYCIDLVCMAGAPISVDSGDERANIFKLMDGSVVQHHELNVTDYISSAESFSGKYNNWEQKVIIGIVCAAAILAAFGGAYIYLSKKGKNKGKELQLDADFS